MQNFRQLLFLTTVLLIIATQCHWKNQTTKAQELLQNEQVLKTFEEGTSKNSHKEKEEKYQGFWQQENILQLTEDNLLSFEKRDEIWLVLFYQPEDSASRGYQDIFKVWEGVASNLDGLMKVATVNCNETTALCKRFDVSKTPKILLFKTDITAKPIAFVGYFSSETIVKFASQNMPNFVQRFALYVRDLNVFVIENFDEAKVIFVLKSSDTPPLFKALSKEFKGQITFAQEYSVQSSLMKQFGVTTSPTLLFLQDPFAYKAVQYQGEFNKVGITSFLKTQYSSFILAKFYRRQEIWLTLFYQSSDLNTTSLHYQQVWKQLTEQLNEVVKVFTFDCDQESEKLVCQEFSVNETPKILLFPRDSGIDASTFTGPVEYEQIASFALAQIKPLVKNITDENYKSFLQENSKIDKVLLFTQENMTYPLFSALSNEFEGRVAFGEVNQSNTNLTNQFQVTSFPTIYFLGPEKNFHQTKYKLGINRDELVRFTRFVSQSAISNDFEGRKDVWLVFFYQTSSFITQHEKEIWAIWKDVEEKLNGRTKAVAVDCAKGVDEMFCEYFAHPAPRALPPVPSIQIFSARTEAGSQNATYTGLMESDLIASFAINQMEAFTQKYN